MLKTKLLQEIRQMQFEKLYDQWRCKRIDEEEGTWSTFIALKEVILKKVYSALCIPT